MTEEDKRRLLHIVIVGGGPTGVEFGAELHDFVREDVSRLYKEEQKLVQVTLIEGRKVLGAFNQKLQQYAVKKIKARKQMELLQASVNKVEANGVTLSDGRFLPCGLVVWSTGLAPRWREFEASVMEKYTTCRCLNKILKVHSCKKGQGCNSANTIRRLDIPRSFQPNHPRWMLLSQRLLHCRLYGTEAKFQLGRGSTNFSTLRKLSSSSLGSIESTTAAPSQASKDTGSGTRQRLVILGTGWGSYSVLKNIDKSLYDVVVVSPRNHFLFTPLLASTTVGTLEFRSIIEPVRNTGFRKSDHFHLAEAVRLDAKNKILTCQSAVDHSSQYDLGYDKLVIGVGAISNTFGVPGVSQHAFFLKEVADARAIRNCILSNFELALHPNMTEEDKRRLLHIVIVGGGPTGVEFGAELHDFVREGVSRLYKEEQKLVQVTLIEGRKVLGAFNQKLQQYAVKKIKARKQMELLQASVNKVEANGVTLSDGRFLPCGLVVWSTGLAPRWREFEASVMEKYTTCRCLNKILKVHSCKKGQGCNSANTIRRLDIPRSFQPNHPRWMLLSQRLLHCRLYGTEAKFQLGRGSTNFSTLRKLSSSSLGSIESTTAAPSQASKDTGSGTRQRLVILGTGWGSYSVLKNIDKSLYDVVVVSPRNHFLFTPLLASTTVGTLEFRSIIEPVRNTGFRKSDHFHLAEAVRLDAKNKVIEPEFW